MPFKDPAARKAYIRAYNAANIEKVRKWSRDSARSRYAKDPEASRAKNTKRRAANAEKHRGYSSRWKLANRGRATANEIRRKASKMQRTPVWADLKKIAAVYAEAQIMTAMMGEPWHVDHVIPLRGRSVSGLHVHQNLRLLSGVENARKYNHFEPG